MNVLDLFSGIGAFSLGLERAGMHTVAFCERDPFCRRVLQKHWPHVPCWDDVRTLRTVELPAVDLICGGWPCQDISVAGKGAGLAGERSGLWSQFTRIIGEVRPRYCVMENVAALLGRGMGEVLGDLAALGYDAEWHCIPASAVGAPHRRDRVWIVATDAERGELRQQQQRLPGGWPRGLRAGGQALAGDDGAARSVADALGAGLEGHAGDVADRDQPGWIEAHPNGPARAGGLRPAVADADGGRRQGRRLAQHLDEQGASGDLFDGCGASGRWTRTDLADADGARCREPEEGDARTGQHRPGAGEDHAARGSGWWAIEPDVGRVVDGAAARVDRRQRLIALGNSLVPQIAEIIGRAIMRREQ